MGQAVIREWSQQGALPRWRRSRTIATPDIHRSDAAEEAAKCLAVHKHTVRRSINADLVTVAGRGKSLRAQTRLLFFTAC